MVFANLTIPGQLLRKFRGEHSYIGSDWGCENSSFKVFSLLAFTDCNLSKTSLEYSRSKNDVNKSSCQ